MIVTVLTLPKNLDRKASDSSLTLKDEKVAVSQRRTGLVHAVSIGQP